MLLFHRNNYDDYEYLGYVEFTSHDPIQLRGDEFIKGIRKIVKQYPRCNVLIHVHNHPNVANAIPSDADIETSETLKKGLGGLLGIRLYDSCIITELDFYSKRQADSKRNNHKK